MNNNDLHEKLVEILEDDNCPSYARVMSIAIIETRKELCYLKKLNKWQVGLIVSLLLTTIAGIIR